MSQNSIGVDCEICGSISSLDRHHVTPKRMGGTKDPAIHDETNLMTLCRQCHRNLHEARWELVRSTEGIRVVDKETGEQVMRRLTNPDYLDIFSLFQILNLTEDSLGHLHQALPYFTDEQLVEAFRYANSFGKRSWLIQAAILYEAQQRSTYGQHTLEAIARRFEIGLRQAQKYALVWKVFFDRDGEQENVNIDAILLDEPSWYVVAVTETKEPETWLAYAQDRKMEDPRYSVASFRRDIMLARFAAGVIDAQEAAAPTGPAMTDGWRCPWVKVLCIHSGIPVPFRGCSTCKHTSENSPELTSAILEA